MHQSMFLAVASLVLLSWACGVQAQQQPPQRSGDAAAGVGIYSCVDARGRTITADRPIADCSDREQRELNPSGTVKRKVEPTPAMSSRTPTATCWSPSRRMIGRS